MKIAILILSITVFVPVSGYSAYVCTDENGNTSFQDSPCTQKEASKTNIPIKATELTDSNSMETVGRFYKAMSERDPIGASKFLTETFTSEVKSGDKLIAKDDKDSITADLKQTLSAATSYSAHTQCRVIKRTPTFYTLSCLVDEQGVVMKRKHRAVSDQTMTIVMDGGLVKIDRAEAKLVDESAPR